jgi:hypothetical protein
MKTIDRFILILLQSLIDKNIDVVVYLMVFNATFNTISFISWRLVLLVEETGENHRPVTSH